MAGRVPIVVHDDCIAAMTAMLPASVDAIVTDPPYGLQFMGKEWDRLWRDRNEADTAYVERTTGQLTSRARKLPDFSTAKPEQIQEFFGAFATAALRVLKPGGHMTVFGHPKTFHRLMVAIEDAGFELRDTLMWVYGSGFPKSLDVSKAIDRAAGASRALTRPGVVRRDGYGEDWDTGSSTDRPRYDEPATPEAKEWQGWGTALKPAYEPIILARKPLIGTVAENVLAYGTGALNIDACRVETVESTVRPNGPIGYHGGGSGGVGGSPSGRWPANLVHDGSDDVLAAFPTSTSVGHHPASRGVGGIGNDGHSGQTDLMERFGDAGSAARFFYCAKAGADDRLGSKHPTVKPIALMRWLVRMVTPPEGIILDPFAGTGTTGEAAYREGFRSILIDREDESIADIATRIGLLEASKAERRRTAAKRRKSDDPDDPDASTLRDGLFAEAAA